MQYGQHEINTLSYTEYMNVLTSCSFADAPWSTVLVLCYIDIRLKFSSLLIRCCRRAPLVATRGSASLGTRHVFRFMICVRCVRFISRIESGCPDWSGLRLSGPLLLSPMLIRDNNQALLGPSLCHGACCLFFVSCLSFARLFGFSYFRSRCLFSSL